MGLHEHPQFANHVLDEPKTFIEGWDKSPKASAGPPSTAIHPSKKDGVPAAGKPGLASMLKSVQISLVDGEFENRLRNVLTTRTPA